VVDAAGEQTGIRASPVEYRHVMAAPQRKFNGVTPDERSAPDEQQPHDPPICRRTHNGPSDPVEDIMV
jgi:hypothetical protein